MAKIFSTLMKTISSQLQENSMNPNQNKHKENNPKAHLKKKTNTTENQD